MFDKIFDRVEQRIKESEDRIRIKIQAEMDGAVRLINETAKNELTRIADKVRNIDNSLKELKSNYESIMNKVDKAGELLLSYESFYESTLVELDEVFKFVEMLNKRPILSTDPDFANFSRAIQLMGNTISKYQSLSETIVQNRKENEAKEEEREIEKGK